MQLPTDCNDLENVGNGSFVGAEGDGIETAKRAVRRTLRNHEWSVREVISEPHTALCQYSVNPRGNAPDASGEP